MTTMVFEDGKYTLISQDGRVSVLWHGEAWRDLTGDKFVGCLISRIEELELQLAQSKPAPVDYLTCTEREVKYMDIYSRPGTKVVFHGRGGYPHQIEGAKKILTLGGVYTVSDMDVGHSRSSVSLVEIHGYFNTVMFGPFQEEAP